MNNRIIDFKTVSPLFEMERDGLKPFTERLVDMEDERFKSIIYGSKLHWGEWAIRITNPTTNESFLREYEGWGWLYTIEQIKHTNWIAIFLGRILT